MKVARHEKIIELIHQYDIDTQEELASRLNDRRLYPEIYVLSS